MVTSRRYSRGIVEGALAQEQTLLVVHEIDTVPVESARTEGEHAGDRPGRFQVAEVEVDATAVPVTAVRALRGCDELSARSELAVAPAGRIDCGFRRRTGGVGPGALPGGFPVRGAAPRRPPAESTRA